jgi:hypothetical protein
MNISFNIPDEYDTLYLEAARWKLGNPPITDNKIINKYLKECIAKAIDSHAKHLATVVEETNLNDITAQREQAQIALLTKQALTDSIASTDMGPD